MFYYQILIFGAMYDGLLHLHSGLRWILLIALVYAIFNAWNRWKDGAKYNVKDKTLNTVTMALLHTQFLIGLIMYIMNFAGSGGKYGHFFNNPGDAMGVSTGRFFIMEHLVLMLAAVVLVTIGRKRAQSHPDPKKKHRRIMVWYAIGLLIILAGIPWPFRFETSGWF